MATQKNPLESYPLMPHDEMVYSPVPHQITPQPPGPVVIQPVLAPNSHIIGPQNVLNCPPGLEYLSTIDQLIIKKKVECLDIKNKYIVSNSLGQQVYFAREESDWCDRFCWGSTRGFDVNVLDNYGQQVMVFHSPLACQDCCFPCCLQSMEIVSPPGTLIGVVQQEWSIFKPSLVIKNANDEIMIRIKGPCWRYRCCADVKFKVYSVSGAEIGKISKQWSGVIGEVCSAAYNFNVSFHADLDVKMKACLLGALFLIDVMFFDSY